MWKFELISNPATGSVVPSVYDPIKGYFLGDDTTFSVVDGISGSGILFNNGSGHVKVRGEWKYCMFNIKNCTRGVAVSAWLKLFSDEDTPILANLNQSIDRTTYGFQLSMESGKLVWKAWYGGQTREVHAGVSIGIWTHVVGNWQIESPSDVSLFINGLNADAYNAPTFVRGKKLSAYFMEIIENDFYIGQTSSYNATESSFIIDEVRLTENFVYSTTKVGLLRSGEFPRLLEQHFSTYTIFIIMLECTCFS